MSFYLGLDLGQTTDPTVAVILEAHGDHPKRLYDIRHIEPYPLGTSYPDIIKAVRVLLERPALQGQCTLVIDQTGVGRAIFDMFVEAELGPIGITITPGKSWHQEEWNQYHVAKELLVGVVQKFLQSERIRSSWRVKHSRLLKKELQSFRVKLTKALNEQYGPDVREGVNDDKVLATAVALWLAEHYTPASALTPAEMRAEWAAAGHPLPPEPQPFVRGRLWGNRGRDGIRGPRQIG
jgi:hypothetical protein